MFYVRRVVASGFLASAGAGAIVAVLAAAHAYAQPMTRPVLRPTLEDNEEPRRETPRRPARRTDTRPAGALPNFDNPETSQLPSFGNPAGIRREPHRLQFAEHASEGLRRHAARTKTQSGLVAAPLSLTAPGTSPTSTLLRNTAAGTSAKPATASTAQRLDGVRCGQASIGRARDRCGAAQHAGPSSRRHAERRRRDRQHLAPDDRFGHAAATAHRRGGRPLRTARHACGRVPGAARAGRDRRLRHQSGAHARRTQFVADHGLARTHRALRLAAP